MGCGVCAYFIYVFYLRIFIVRLPTKIDINFVSIYLCLFYWFLVLVFGYLFYKKIRPVLYDDTIYLKKSHQSYIWQRVSEKLLELAVKVNSAYKFSIKAVYSNFIDPSHWLKINITHKITFFISDLIDHYKIKNLRTFFYVYFGFCLMPRIIAVICLFLDITFRQEFHYLYRYGWVLVIPLLWNLVWYLVKQRVLLDCDFISLFFHINFITDPKVLLEKYGHTEPTVSFVRQNNPYILESFPLTDAEYDEMIDDCVKLMRVRDKYVNIYESGSQLYQMLMYNYAMTFIYGVSLMAWSCLAIYTTILLS